MLGQSGHGVRIQEAWRDPSLQQQPVLISVLLSGALGREDDGRLSDNDA